MVLNVMEKTVAIVMDRAMIYKAVLQTLILYGSNSWVVIEAMLKLLEVSP